MTEPELDPRQWKETITTMAPDFLTGFEVRDPPPILYHYTGMEAFRSIVSSGEFWFTDVAYMNDAGEIRYAEDLIRKVVAGEAESLGMPAPELWANEVVDRLPDVVTNYALSLSEEADSLPQWRGYCRAGGGVALGLNLAVEPGGECVADDHALDLFPIEYDRQTQEGALALVSHQHFRLYNRLWHAAEAAGPDGFGVGQHEVMALLFVYLRAAVQSTAARFKDRHWSSEREWRLAITSTPPRLGVRLQFRTGPIGLTPYVSAPLRRQTANLADKLPLCEVIVGPGEHQALNAAAIGQFLAREGYPEVRIRMSDVPLRY